MIIKRPRITEKNNDFAQFQTYVFEVDRKATKDEIKFHIEKYLDVKVKSVRTAQCRKKARRNSRGYGKVPYYKKAIVRLHKGERISIFEGAQ